MIPFLDCSQHKLQEIAEKLGAKEYGQLLTPLTNYALAPNTIFGIDNGGFTRQNANAFAAVVKKCENDLNRCKFVVMPDCPGDARRTLELFHIFKDTFKSLPLAIAIQDGIENLDIPWKEISAVFIAGSGEWCYEPPAVAVVKAARWLGKWIHVGRVSNPQKWDFFTKLGCNSADSSALVRPFPGRTDKMTEYFQKELFK